MYLLVIDFTYLERRNFDIVVKELEAFDFQNNNISSYHFKKPYASAELLVFNARINEAIDQGYNWNDGNVLYSEL